MLWQFFFGAQSWGLLIDQSGEWAVRMLIADARRLARSASS